MTKLSLALLLFLGPRALPVTREVYVMGTSCVLTAYAPAEEAGRQQIEKYLRVLEETENELSVWRPDTPLGRLNATPVGERFAVSSGLFKLFEEIAFWWKETDRAFDPAVGQLTGRGGKTIGMQHILLDGEAQQIIREADVSIDSGAFGKGEGLDRAIREAARERADPFLIDLGGQVVVYGRPPGQSSWPVDIAHPLHRDRAALTLQLKSGSLSTSGNSEQPGHIVDPRTARPVLFNGSVVVWHERALIADVLSTALFVMGPKEGIQWANGRGFAALFLVPDGNRLTVRATSAFSEMFEID